MSETMTEKLQTIAENVPKVYNKGFEDGKAECSEEGNAIIEKIHKTLATLVEVEQYENAI